MAGGLAVAWAISVVLLQFGATAGLALGAPTLADGATSWNVLAAGLWVVLVSIASASAGGYLAGRMRARHGDGTENEVEVRDGVHGLVVWAGATVGVALVTALAGLLASAAAGSLPNPMPNALNNPATGLSDDVLRLADNGSLIFGFATAAGAALAAAAAWFAATTGGQHRDEGLSVHRVVPALFRRKAK
ncbi:MAG: hypothetical protein ACFB13_04175 [Kiloniellaceae bacterium]